MRTVRELLLLLSPDEVAALLEHFEPDKIPEQIKNALTPDEWKALFKASEKVWRLSRARALGLEVEGPH